MPVPPDILTNNYFYHLKSKNLRESKYLFSLNLYYIQINILHSLVYKHWILSRFYHQNNFCYEWFEITISLLKILLFSDVYRQIRTNCCGQTARVQYYWTRCCYFALFIPEVVLIKLYTGATSSGNNNNTNNTYSQTQPFECVYSNVSLSVYPKYIFNIKRTKLYRNWELYFDHRGTPAPHLLHDSIFSRMTY